jgi:hypothetical protein
MYEDCLLVSRNGCGPAGHARGFRFDSRSRRARQMWSSQYYDAWVTVVEDRAVIGRQSVLVEGSMRVAGNVIWSRTRAWGCVNAAKAHHSNQISVTVTRTDFARNECQQLTHFTAELADLMAECADNAVRVVCEDHKCPGIDEQLAARFDCIRMFQLVERPTRYDNPLDLLASCHPSPSLRHDRRK